LPHVLFTLGRYGENEQKNTQRRFIMRKPLIAAALLALTIFGVGYVIGQVRGTPSSFAATNAPANSSNPTFLYPSDAGQAAAGSAASVSRHADGTVTAVSGNTITIKADNDAAGSNEYTSVTTIQLTSSTQYNVSGGKSGIKVGSHIVAEGNVSSDGKTMTATQVSTGGPGGCPHGASSSGATTSSDPGTNA
jgi:Domain of unknown function (DUF5666)